MKISGIEKLMMHGWLYVRMEEWVNLIEEYIHDRIYISIFVYRNGKDSSHVDL